MATPIRAIYKNGQLQLFAPLDLAEGAEVEVMIVGARSIGEQASLEALKHLLVNPVSSEYEFGEIDEEAIMAELREAFKGQPPLSDDIIRERQEGP